MTNYFVDSLQETTTTNANGLNMAGTDSLFVASSGEIVALGSGSVSGIFLNNTSTNNTVTMDGEVYCAQGDGIYSQSTNLSLMINGSITSGVDAIDLFGNSDVFIGAGAVVESTSTAIGLQSSATAATFTIDGTVISTRGSGLYIDAPSNITIGTGGYIHANTNGLYLDTGSAGTYVYNGGFIGTNHDSNNNIYIAGANIHLDNTGTITGPNDPININAANTLFINSGTVTGQDGGAIVMFGGANGSTIHNAGTIVGSLQDAGAVGSVIIENSGTWFAPDGGLSATAFDDTLNNSGTIHGVVDMGTGADAVDNSGRIIGSIFFEGGSDTLDNSGVIKGSIALSGGDVLTNGGTIHGDVNLGTGDIVSNDGVIQGTVTMATGDTFDTGSGKLTGIITANTVDTFDFGGNFGHYKIADFATAGVSHDIIDFASDDFTSYTELQSHMAQVGSNVVITLDGSDNIILLSTKLSSLVSHDFHFG